MPKIVEMSEIKQNMYGNVIGMEDAIKLYYGSDSVLVTTLDVAWKTISLKEKMTEAFIIANIEKLDHQLLLENPNIEMTPSIKALLTLL